MPLVAVLLSVTLMLAAPMSGAAGTATAEPAPAFDSARDAWINSEPLEWQALHGKVVLLNVWTHGCGNCTRSLPWLESVQTKYAGRGLQIIGIHSPEFAWEKPRQAVAEAVERHGIGWPVMLDNGFRYWDALGNRYWPAFYIVDRQGRIAGRYVGETHAFDGNAKTMESLIEALLVDE